MTKHFTFLATLAAAAAAAASPALAQNEQPMPVGEVFNAWTKICKDHHGDHDAQVAAATSAPFNAVEFDHRSDGSVVYKQGSMLIILRDNPELTYCMIGGWVEGALDLDADRKPMIALYGPPSKVEDGHAFWHIGVSHYAVSGGTTNNGRTTILYASGVDKD